MSGSAGQVVKSGYFSAWGDENMFLRRLFVEEGAKCGGRADWNRDPRLVYVVAATKGPPTGIVPLYTGLRHNDVGVIIQ